MQNIYLFFAVVGGTILIVQFVLSLLGAAGDMEIADDMPDGDFSMESGGDAGHDVAGDSAHDAAVTHHGAWLLGMLSFKTIVAASAFFGLGGLIGLSLSWSPLGHMGLALAMGFGAMYGVYMLMKSLGKLTQDGTLRIDRAIGEIGTVYIPIPAGATATGKVHVKVQGRLEELAAVTNGSKRLNTGAKVVVIGVVGPGTLAVEPAEPIEHDAPEPTTSAAP